MGLSTFPRAGGVQEPPPATYTQASVVDEVPMKTFVQSVAVALAMLVPTAAQPAQIKDQATFDVVIRGISAATLSFSGVQDGTSYSVAGRLQSAGIAALLRKISYDAKVQGSLTKGRYTPSSYGETSDNGKKRVQSRIAYRRGVPQQVEYTPARAPRENAVDPAGQGGTVDTLTALYALLRDVDAGSACNLKIPMFDGRYVSSIALGKPATNGATVTCNGEYRRIAGFSPEDMAKRTRFPFTLTYQALGDGRLRVTEVAMQSVYGTAVMKRR